MSTRSPASICGAMECPSTRGSRTKNNDTKARRTTHCTMRAPAWRSALTFAARRSNSSSARIRASRCSAGPAGFRGCGSTGCCLGDGLVEHLRAGDRPEDHKGVSYELIPLQETPEMRVVRVVAIVAEHDVIAVRHAIRRLPGGFRRDDGARGVERNTVHHQVVVLELELVV